MNEQVPARQQGGQAPVQDGLDRVAGRVLGPSGGRLALTGRLAEGLCKRVAQGASLSAAAAQLGVTPRTARAWRQRGLAVLARVDDGTTAWTDLDARERALGDFAIRVRRAEAEAELAAMRAVQEAIDGAREPDGSLSLDAHGRPVRRPDWRAAAWWLERGPLRRSWRRADSAADVAEDGVSERRAARRAGPVEVVIVGDGTGP